MCEIAEAKREEFDPEHDARTLGRAQEIKNHAGRMSAVTKHVNHLHAALGQSAEARGKGKKRSRRRGGGRS